MKILVLNCGSSTVKFQVIEIDSDSIDSDRDRKLATGMVDRLGDEATLKFRAGEAKAEEKVAARTHEAAVRLIIERLAAQQSHFDAVGHRVVHGGDVFTQAVVIDAPVIARIEALNDLAPLHNPAAISGIRAAQSVLGTTMRMAAVFDTAFHHTMPAHAATYAIPAELARKHRIRRYGFHGMAHQYSLLRFSRITATPEAQARLVTLHLGNGCSACAISGGRSVDTSMGLTPLEGLVMGTRSGDIDPALIDYLSRQEQVSAAEVDDWLNHRSGLLGLSGISNDMRELLQRYEQHPRARLAVDVFCYRARKYLGAYLAALGGAQAVIFSGGIGENAAAVREKICAGMEWCGLSLDREKNHSAVGAEALISPPNASIHVYVIPTDEEAIIARDTARLFR